MTEPKAASQDDSSTGRATEQAFQSAVAPLGGEPKSEKVAGSIPAYPAGAAPAMPEFSNRCDEILWKGQNYDAHTEALQAKLNRTQAAVRDAREQAIKGTIPSGEGWFRKHAQAIKESEK